MNVSFFSFSSICVFLFVLLAAVIVVVLGGILFFKSRKKNHAPAKAYLAAQDFDGFAAYLVEHIGGAQNIKRLEHCVNRLRLEVENPDLVDEKALKNTDISGLMRPEKTKIQLVIGSRTKAVFDALKSLVG